jgi:hypothetical protein
MGVAQSQTGVSINRIACAGVNRILQVIAQTSLQICDREILGRNSAAQVARKLVGPLVVIGQVIGCRSTEPCQCWKPIASPCI